MTKADVAGSLAALYVLAVVIFGAFYVLNLFLAVMWHVNNRPFKNIDSRRGGTGSDGGNDSDGASAAGSTKSSAANSPHASPVPADGEGNGSSLLPLEMRQDTVLERLVNSPSFTSAGVGLIVLNVLAMMLEHHPQEPGLTNVLEVTNLLITLLFTVEMLFTGMIFALLLTLALLLVDTVVALLSASELLGVDMVCARPFSIVMLLVGRIFALAFAVKLPRVDMFFALLSPIEMLLVDVIFALLFASEPLFVGMFLAQLLVILALLTAAGEAYQFQDPHTTLGVPRGASTATIKAAFRRAALIYHPDRNLGDNAAARHARHKFQEASEAYEMLVGNLAQNRFAASPGPEPAPTGPPPRTRWRRHGRNVRVTVEREEGGKRREVDLKVRLSELKSRL